MIKPFGLAIGLVMLPLAGQASEVCDFEDHCCNDAPPHQTYHMDPSNPDRETPPPAPQYPSAVAQGRDIVVQPNACHLFKIRSVPTIEPKIIEIRAGLANLDKSISGFSA